MSKTESKKIANIAEDENVLFSSAIMADDERSSAVPYSVWVGHSHLLMMVLLLLYFATESRILREPTVKPRSIIGFRKASSANRTFGNYMRIAVKARALNTIDMMSTRACIHKVTF